MSKPVRVTVKDPDAIFEADLTEEERRIIVDEYSEWGEYFTLEIDFMGRIAKLLSKAEQKR